MATGTLTLSQYVFNKGLQEGLAKGKEKWLAEGKERGLAEGVVKVLLSMNKGTEEICEQLVLICKMSPEQARQTLESLSKCN